jgi:hypothetical protein
LKKNLCFAALLSCTVLSSANAEEDIPSVTPYRPTISNPAVLSRPGWLEVESGWINSTATDSSTRGSLPYTFKLAFTDSFGVLLGGEALVNQVDAVGARTTGAGDTSLLLKNKWSVSENGNAAFGLEYGFVSPTAQNGLGSGSGKTDYLVNGIFSTDVSGNTIDLNVNVTELGNVLPDESNKLWGWAATWSTALNDTWGIAAEFSGASRQGQDPNSQFLAAVNYATSKRVVWDAGFSSAINPLPGAMQWSVFGGVSVLVGQIF